MNAKETQPKADPAATAAALIRRHGRVTPARLNVLRLLLDADSALSHADLEAQLEHGVDRVTLYRVLEWLVRCGLAHRIAGEDRIWRFSAVATAARAGHEHAHFLCESCGRTYCLDDLRPVFAMSLPAGFRCREAELTLHGLCPRCAGAAPA